MWIRGTIFDIDQAFSGTLNNLAFLETIERPGDRWARGITQRRFHHDQRHLHRLQRWPGTSGGEYADFRDGTRQPQQHLLYQFSESSDVELDDDNSSASYRMAS